jgi:hypothetical protein
MCNMFTILINKRQTTRRFNPEDSHLRTHCRQNLESYLIKELAQLGFD